MYTVCDHKAKSCLLLYPKNIGNHLECLRQSFCYQLCLWKTRSELEKLYALSIRSFRNSDTGTINSTTAITEWINQSGNNLLEEHGCHLSVQNSVRQPIIEKHEYKATNMNLLAKSGPQNLNHETDLGRQIKQAYTSCWFE